MEEKSLSIRRCGCRRKNAGAIFGFGRTESIGCLSCRLRMTGILGKRSHPTTSRAGHIGLVHLVDTRRLSQPPQVRPTFICMNCRQHEDVETSASMTAQCQIECQIWGPRGIAGEVQWLFFSNLLILKGPAAGSSPSLTTIKLKHLHTSSYAQWPMRDFFGTPTNTPSPRR